MRFPMYSFDSNMSLLNNNLVSPLMRKYFQFKYYLCLFVIVFAQLFNH